MGAYAGGSDQSGYLNNARMLGQGHVTTPMRLLPGFPPETLPPYTYVPLGFIPNQEQATLTPTYPMGLPLLMLAVAKLTGWGLAPGLTLGLHALLGLWLVYRLGRARSWRRLGLAGHAAARGQPALYFCVDPGDERYARVGLGDGRRLVCLEKP